MVTVGMNYHVREGKAEAFEKVFEKVIQIMSGIDGHVKTDLYANTKAPRQYLIMSEWSDRAAFDAFIASEQFRNVANWGKEEVLVERPSHNYYGDQAPAPAGHSAPSTTAPATGKCPYPGH